MAARGSIDREFVRRGSNARCARLAQGMPAGGCVIRAARRGAARMSAEVQRASAARCLQLPGGREFCSRR
jgi:hypothetical protein